MKRTSAAIALAALATILANTNASPLISAAPAVKSADPCASKPSKFQRDQCAQYTKSAPGDEYFGRLKLSYLGINNTFRDSAIRSGAYTLDSGIISKVNFADDALHAWSNKYPGDPQLARSYYLAIEAFTRIYTQPAQDKAFEYMNILVKKFPSSYFGKLMKKNLQIGFTKHYFANALPCPTPLPPGSPVNGLSSSPAPVPTDTPTPSPGQAKVQIITPPCVPPPSPTPLPTTEPTMIPTVMPSPMALPSVMPTPTTSPSP